MTLDTKELETAHALYLFGSDYCMKHGVDPHAALLLAAISVLTHADCEEQTTDAVLDEVRAIIAELRSHQRSTGQ